MFGFGGSKPKEENKSGGVYKEADVNNQFGRSDSESASPSIMMPTGRDIVDSMGSQDLGKKPT